MRAVIHKVVKASVTIDGELVSSIQRGLCVLVGICRDDTQKELHYIVNEILNAKLFDDDEGNKWSKNVTEKKYEILCLSQFTLYSVLKGNKPDFRAAMNADTSREFYGEFLKQMKTAYHPAYIKEGRFRVRSLIDIYNDGPTTIEIEAIPETPKENKMANKTEDDAVSSTIAGSSSFNEGS